MSHPTSLDNPWSRHPLPPRAPDFRDRHRTCVKSPRPAGMTLSSPRRPGPPSRAARPTHRLAFSMIGFRTMPAAAPTNAKGTRGRSYNPLQSITNTASHAAEALKIPSPTGYTEQRRALRTGESSFRHQGGVTRRGAHPRHPPASARGRGVAIRFPSRTLWQRGSSSQGQWPARNGLGIGHWSGAVRRGARATVLHRRVKTIRQRSFIERRGHTSMTKSNLALFFGVGGMWNCA